MIITSGMLVRELKNFEDHFLTVMLEGKEYIVDSILHIKDYTDSPHSHIALKVKDGGEGNIKR